MTLVNSTIDEYVLASFAVPASASSTTSATARPSALAPPPATSVQYPSAPKQDGRIVVATPGVGVSVYDLADQTPLSSITVGPSFAPTTSAVARSVPLTTSESIRVKSQRQTWVGVRTDQGKGEIWCWHEDERKDGSSETEAGKAIWPISEPLAALAVPKSLPAHLVFLSQSGSFALAPADDLTSLVSLPYHSDEPSTSARPVPSSQTLRLIPVSSTSAPSFLPASLVALLPAATATTRAHIAVIVRSFATTKSVADPAASLAEIGKKKFKKTPRPSASAVTDAAEASSSESSQSSQSTTTKNEIEVVLLDPEVRVEGEAESRSGVVSLGRITVEADKAVVSDDGYLTSLTADGILASSRLAVPTPTSESYPDLFFPSPAEARATVSLALAPVKSVALSSSTLVSAQATLLALRSSFVLVAAPRASSSSSSTPVVSLTYWDARFGAVVAASDLTVPSAVATTRAGLALSASLPTRNTAIVTLAPASASASASRIALFCLPLSPPLPTASVLAAIVGRQRLTAQYLASSSSAGADSSSVIARAQRSEPILPSSSSTSSRDRDSALAGRAARTALLESLEKTLAPLQGGDNAARQEQDAAVREAEHEWSRFLESERKRTWDLEQPRVVERRKAAAEARIERLKADWVAGQGEREGSDGRVSRRVRRVVERAIVDAGASTDVDPSSASSSPAAASSWKSVTNATIKGVDGEDRKKYIAARGRVESEIERLRRDAQGSIDDADRPEPSLPSSFVTAVLRLSFPVALDSPSSDLVASSSAPSSSSTTTWRHPTSIIRYLIERDLVGENQIEGGLTRYLARAGDWANIVLALEHVSDIPESTSVALLVAVVRARQRSAAVTKTTDSMDVDDGDAVSAASSGPPSLDTFLAAFLRQRSTPATLREALQRQVSATEALPILAQCDHWLASSLKKHGRGRGESGADATTTSSSFAEPKTEMVLVDPFTTTDRAATAAPGAESVVPLVEALLDAKCVALLLERESHRVLRRLATHVAEHQARLDDLATLLGGLAVFKRTQDAADRLRVEQQQQHAVRKEVKKAFGDGMERRSKAHEKHQEVGAYQVEEFYL
ncbi:hypothetical protein JCM11491_005641 [Sporobolomyces phaffii]